MELKSEKTGLIYDLRMTEHRCLWNPGYPECPERFERILARYDELKLIERCHSIPSRPATLNEILLKHTREHYDALKVFNGETDEAKLEAMCTHYDVFLHPSYSNENILCMSLDLGDAKDPVDSSKDVNIPMNKVTVGDSDYVAAFQRIIMPIAYEFNPELVLVSADFSAINELFVANISPEIFGYLTHWLSALANGKLVLFVNGACSATSACINGLLGNPLPIPKDSTTGANVNNIETIQNVLSIQQNNWKSLKFNKLLPRA